MEVLFKTVHGSRLYGLSNENSDYDFYTVVSKVRTARAKYARQSIIGDTDSMVVDFGTWLMQVEAGVPQACEAMMSQMPLEDKLGAFRNNYVLGTGVWERYLRTIKSFSLSEDNSFKKKRHALRLALNFQELRLSGRFDPTLSEFLARAISGLATDEPEAVYAAAMGIAWA